MSPVLPAERVVPTPVPATTPLSFPQRQMWLIEGMEPTGALYNEVTLVRLDGDLDRDVLLRCLNELVARHDALRSTFQVVDGEAACRVLPTVELSFGEPVDLSGLPEPDRERVLGDIANGLGAEPYDLAAGPLIRTALVRLGRRAHALLIGTHHIIVDGWSVDLLLSELHESYRAFTTDPAAAVPPPLPASYADFARWQRTESTGPAWAEDLEFWRTELAGAQPLLDLTSGRLRPAVKHTGGSRIRVPLGPGVATAARQLARSAGSTQHSVLLAAFAAVLHRHTDRQDLVIGTEAAGRPAERFEPVVGFFANLVPLRLFPSPDQTFADFLDHVTDVTLESLEHQHLPFSQLVQHLNPERDLSYGPVVQVVFSRAEFSEQPRPIGDLTGRHIQVNRSRSRFDLLVEAQDHGDSVVLWVEFDTELFTEDWVRSLCRHYENLLTAVLREPRLRLADVPMLRPVERERAIATTTPIGAPTPATDVVLLDGQLLAPTGAVGRVHQVHPTLCSLSHDRLVGVVAPTGELGYWATDGTLVRLGPAEVLPRVHGAWVPLAQVRAAIAVHPSVRSVTVAVEDGHIVARLATAGPSTTAVAQLRDHLATRLPRHAVPDEFRCTTGPVESTSDSRAADLVDVVLAVLREVLDQPELGPDDDFFAMGGHSMLAAQAGTMLRDRHGVQVPLRKIFEYPNARELAEVLAGQPAAVARSRTGEAARHVPLTAAQADIWIVNQLAGDEPVNNIPVSVTVEGPVDGCALQRAFAAVVARHEVLRSGFGLRQGRLAQWPLTEPPTLRLSSVTCLPAKLRAEEVERLRHDEARRPFRLGTEPPIRAVLVTTDRDRAELVVTVHHIAVDGVGMAVFCRELGAHYRSELSGAPTPAAPKLSWPEYANWEDTWLAAEREELTGFWRDRLTGLRPVELPTELPRPARLSFVGATHTHRLPVHVADGLANLAVTSRTTPFQVSVAALAVLLHATTGATDVPIATPTANRHLAESLDLVGCTISMVLLRADCAGDPTFADLLSGARDATLDAFAHQGLPASSLAKLADEGHRGGRSGLTAVSFDWQEAGDLAWDLAGCRTEWRYGGTDRARNELVLSALRRDGEVDLVAEYNTALWTETGAAAWLSGLAEVLAEAVADPTRHLSTFTAVAGPTDR